MTKTSSDSPWWYCGHCSYPNHPRARQDVKKCEQCGKDKDELAVDYKPTGA